MNKIVPRLLSICLIAGVAVLGSIAGRALWESVTAQDQPQAIAPSEAIVNDEAAKPRFEGEVLGVFIGPPNAQVPDKFVTHRELCGSLPSEQVGWDKAGQFDLQIELPQSFTLDVQSLNTGVIACGDTVTGARWAYTAPQPNGYTGGLVIARSAFKYDQLDVSTDRVQASEIGGQPAVVIKPVIASGIGSGAGVIFPGDSVTTSVQSYGVPETDLLIVAEIVAAEIKKESRGD